MICYSICAVTVDIALECLVVILAQCRAAMDERYQLELPAETELFVRCSVEIVGEDIPDALAAEAHAGVEFVVAAQRGDKPHAHSRHDGVGALSVQFREAYSAGVEEEMTGVLGIVHIVGIVDDTFDIALVVSHHDLGFKDILLVHQYSVLSSFSLHMSKALIASSGNRISIFVRRSSGFMSISLYMKSSSNPMLAASFLSLP